MPGAREVKAYIKLVSVLPTNAAPHDAASHKMHAGKSSDFAVWWNDEAADEVRIKITCLARKHLEAQGREITSEPIRAIRQ